MVKSATASGGNVCYLDYVQNVTLLICKKTHWTHPWIPHVKYAVFRQTPTEVRSVATMQLCRFDHMSATFQNSLTAFFSGVVNMKKIIHWKKEIFVFATKCQIVCGNYVCIYIFALWLRYCMCGWSSAGHPKCFFYKKLRSFTSQWDINIDLKK